MTFLPGKQASTGRGYGTGATSTRTSATLDATRGRHLRAAGRGPRARRAARCPRIVEVSRPHGVETRPFPDRGHGGPRRPDRASTRSSTTIEAPSGRRPTRGRRLPRRPRPDRDDRRVPARRDAGLDADARDRADPEGPPGHHRDRRAQEAFVRGWGDDRDQVRTDGASSLFASRPALESGTSRYRSQGEPSAATQSSDIVRGDRPPSTVAMIAGHALERRREPAEAPCSMGSAASAYPTAPSMQISVFSPGCRRYRLGACRGPLDPNSGCPGRRQGRSS